jgi:hypothetical protein
MHALIYQVIYGLISVLNFILTNTLAYKKPIGFFDITSGSEELDADYVESVGIALRMTGRDHLFLYISVLRCPQLPQSGRNFGAFSLFLCSN